MAASRSGTWPGSRAQCWEAIMLQPHQVCNSVAIRVDACSLRKQCTGVSTVCIFVYYGMIICGYDNLRDKTGSGVRQGVFWFLVSRYDRLSNCACGSNQ